MTNVLSERAVLVKLSSTSWRGKKQDKAVAQEIAQKYDINPRVGKYQKRLLKSDALQRFHDNVRNARAFHNMRTLPWLDEGMRILPSKLFMEYSGEVRNFIATSENCRDEFVAEYEDCKAQAKQELKGLFKESEYPPANRIAGRFSLSLGVYPIPEAGDFRVKLGVVQQNQIKKELTEQLQAVERQAMEDVWHRVYAMLEKLHDTFANDKRIYKSTLAHAEELINLLPKLNIADDPQLNKLGQEIKLKVLSTNIETLKGDDTVRKETARKADKILKAMSGYAQAA